MKINWRHLRLVLSISKHGSANAAAREIGVSQQAVSQAIDGLEDSFGIALFTRKPSGHALTAAGEVVSQRVKRALSTLDPALARLSPRLARAATAAQLRAFAALVDTGSTTMAARQLGIAQPTVHRAVTHFEKETATQLFERAWHGLRAKKPARDLAQAYLSAMSELSQIEGDLAALHGSHAGHISIGAMPLARVGFVAPAVAAFQARAPNIPIRIMDGSYEGHIHSLQRGDIEVLVGA